MITISKVTQRRFLLGRQGLWPGRRWRGPAGLVQAVDECEAIQMDPLNVMARSHDIALWGRVLDYQPADLDAAMYRQRKLFDYGGCLFFYPMAELPYWRLHMRRAANWPRQKAFAEQNPHVLQQVQDELRLRGPLGNRDFDGNARVHSYRGRKDTALALFYLWLTGELMIHHRRGFDRVYDFRHNVLPPELEVLPGEQETEAYFERKALAFAGLARAGGWATAVAEYIQRRMQPDERRQRLQEMLASGRAMAVQVEGERELRYALASDGPLLETLQAGHVPEAWQPQETTTEQEVTFLAPLEITSARGRAARVFNFDYVWEVYKPAEQRRWGYYTLPVLYGDRLVARLDGRLERKASTLVIKGFWLEDFQPANDPAFASAMQRGLARFTRLLKAERIQYDAPVPGMQG